jgi:hypothetical protein
LVDALLKQTKSVPSQFLAIAESKLSQNGLSAFEENGEKMETMSIME